MAAVQSDAKQLQKDKKRLEKDITVLKDQLAIHKQQLRTLGQKTACIEPEKEMQLQEAVVREIKRRRKNSISVDAPITLQEGRAHDGANIGQLIKENKLLLTPWSEIMANCLIDKEP